MHIPRIHIFLLSLSLALSVLGSACKTGDGGEVAPYPAPALGLVDLNPTSPTYQQTLDVGDANGAVIVLYFANFG